MNTFPKREVKIREADGTETSYWIRPFKCGDEAGIIDCIREEYGDTYFKRDFYDPEKVRKYAETGHTHFFVMEHDGFVAGMVILAVFDDGEDYVEPATHILRKKYRGTILGASLAYYALEMGESLRPCCLFVHAVTFHKGTQTLCENYGMVPVGFRLRKTPELFIFRRRLRSTAAESTDGSASVRKYAPPMKPEQIFPENQQRP